MMPLEQLLCGLLETTINRLQQLDASAQQKRKMLNGCVIGVALKELNKPLYFIISKQQIDILSHYSGQTDCFIRVNIAALKELRNNHQLTQLIKTEQLEVEGDIQQAQQFSQLLIEMNIDWEELLSSKIGDVLAHKFCYHSKLAQQAFSSQLKKLQQQSAQFITEELKVAPCALEVAHFCEQVTTINRQINKLEERIQLRFKQIR